MKIGLVLSKPPAYSETFFISKIKGLQQNGHEVVLFVQSNDKNFNLCKVRTAFPIFKKNMIKQLWWFFKAFYKLLFHVHAVRRFIKLERKMGVGGVFLLKKIYLNMYILSEQLDWLHFGFATMALGKENVAKSIRAKMAVSFRGFDMAIYPIKKPGCYELLWKCVDKVHAISDDLYALALQQGLSTQIPHQKITPAIDIELFEGSPKRTKLKDAPLKIITVARLHWKKGLTYTLQALKQLKDAGVDFQYTIVGTGDEYEKLMYIRHQLGLEDQVRFVGKVSHTKIKELLIEHEFYLQYSISEGFCNAVLEAQAMGLLCLVSDAEGLPENVLHKKSGWVVPKRAPDMLAVKLISVSKLTEERKSSIREFAVKRVRREFNLNEQRKEFLEFYR